MAEKKQEQESLFGFQRVLFKQGLKCTYERRLVYEEVQKLQGHFDCEGLYELFKQKKIKVSRATVFRTVPLLLESGLVQKAIGNGKQEYFELVSGNKHHDHLMCTGCGKIVEFCSPEIERQQKKICTDNGFQLSFHEQRLFGKCSQCLPQKSD